MILTRLCCISGIALIGLLLLWTPARAEEQAVEDLQEGVDSLVRQLSESMERNTLTTVAILDLVNLDLSVSNLGRYVTERSITALHKSGKFTVIERDLLERTLKKLNLTIQDLADPANIQLLARALNIQALVKGSVSDLGETVELNTRVVRAVDNAGAVVAVAQVSVRKDDQVAKLLGQAVLRRGATGAQPPTPTVPAGAQKEIKIDMGQGVVLEMVLIPAGEFDMGSPVKEANRKDNEQLHRVRITKPFYLGKYEVTQALWMVVMGENLSRFRNMKAPVMPVSWEDCQKFLARLNKMVEGGGFRLPTEAEWEYACRAGTQTAYSFGDDEEDLGEYAWYGANSGEQTQEVGKKKANAWGLYDMPGNVAEWCSDWYGKYEFTAGKVTVDPIGPGSGVARVLRGGSWGFIPWDCRSAYRFRYSPDSRYYFNGFRVALDLK